MFIRVNCCYKTMPRSGTWQWISFNSHFEEVQVSVTALQLWRSSKSCLWGSMTNWKCINMKCFTGKGNHVRLGREKIIHAGLYAIVRDGLLLQLLIIVWRVGLVLDGESQISKTLVLFQTIVSCLLKVDKIYRHLHHALMQSLLQI